jgi:DNA repair exonuclease SbcCD nuclease subunit
MTQFPKISFPNVKRIWFISDTHLGIRNNSNEWIDIISDYFTEWFFPLVRKHYQPGDVIVHLGDWYDSRQSVNLRVLNLGVHVAESLADLFPDGVHILVGNHDIWGKSSNEINSLKSLKWIPGIRVYEEPASVSFGKKSFFFMPWRKDHEAERECLDLAAEHDYLCCHTDIRGLKFNRSVSIESGIGVQDLAKFQRIYSGHIHYAQESGRIKILGSPYALTRSDSDNVKGITLLDLQSGRETFFENTFSPRFQKISFDEILNMSIEECERAFDNNFLDVWIDPKMVLKAPLNIFTDSVTTARKISFHPHESGGMVLLSDHVHSVEPGSFSVMNFVESFVSALDYDDQTKEKLVKSINKLYSFATSDQMS